MKSRKIRKEKRYLFKRKGESIMDWVREFVVAVVGSLTFDFDAMLVVCMIKEFVVAIIKFKNRDPPVHSDNCRLRKRKTVVRTDSNGNQVVEVIERFGCCGCD